MATKTQRVWSSKCSNTDKFSFSHLLLFPTLCCVVLAVRPPPRLALIDDLIRELMWQTLHEVLKLLLICFSVRQVSRFPVLNTSFSSLLSHNVYLFIIIVYFIFYSACIQVYPTLCALVTDFVQIKYINLNFSIFNKHMLNNIRSQVVLYCKYNCVHIALQNNFAVIEVVYG